MKLIKTDEVETAKILARAKNLMEESGLQSSDAMEQAARELGYDNWFHAKWCEKETEKHMTYMGYYAEKAKGVEVKRLLTKGNKFHAVEIEGLIFCAEVNLYDPYLVRYAKERGNYGMGWVQLGHAAKIMDVNSWTQENDDQVGQEWHICKYDACQNRISLEGLSSAGRHALAYEFGIDIRYSPGDLDEDEQKHVAALRQSLCSAIFFESPAFVSLCDYAKAHPKKAKQWKPGSYLGNWCEAARTGKPLKHVNLLGWMD